MCRYVFRALNVVAFAALTAPIMAAASASLAEAAAIDRRPALAPAAAYAPLRPRPAVSRTPSGYPVLAARRAGTKKPALPKKSTSAKKSVPVKKVVAVKKPVPVKKAAPVKKPVVKPPAVPVGSRLAPLGPRGRWKLLFEDDFLGRRVNWRVWTDHSTAERDHERGNKPNGQLEWNQGKNCTVSRGVLTQTAKPDTIISPSGERYDWSSCLLTSAPRFAFMHGYMEIRSIVPTAKGFWPSWWTWHTSITPVYTETDAMEYWTSNPRMMFHAQHSGANQWCWYTLPFDPSKTFHIYGADIKLNGTDFYVDGKKSCSLSATQSGLANVLIANFVHNRPAPAKGTIGQHKVDYVRVWKRA